MQWTEQLVLQQRQKTEKIKKEIDLQLAMLDAEREKQVLAIELDKEILRKEGEKKQSALQNAIMMEREQSLADAEAYKDVDPEHHKIKNKWKKTHSSMINAIKEAKKNRPPTALANIDVQIVSK